MVVTILISLKRFKDGGEAILNISSKNHHNLITGKLKAKPLFIYRLRLLKRKYVLFVRKNKPEEASPWDSESHNPPSKDQLKINNMVRRQSPICITEEYAIRDFKSTCRKQTKHKNKFPIRLIEIHVQLSFSLIFLVLKNIRSKAYLPNFKVIPASIIEPIVGASTCALGNHK